MCVCGLRKQPMFTGPLLGSPIWGTLYHEPSADYRSYDLVFLHLNLTIEIFATFRCCCCFFHQPFIYPINRLGYFLIFAPFALIHLWWFYQRRWTGPLHGRSFCWGCKVVISKIDICILWEAFHYSVHGNPDKQKMCFRKHSVTPMRVQLAESGWKKKTGRKSKQRI